MHGIAMGCVFGGLGLGSLAIILLVVVVNSSKENARKLRKEQRVRREQRVLWRAYENVRNLLADVLDESCGAGFCVICQDNTRNVVLLPCKHLCVCPTCKGSVDACPLCREPILGRLQVFL